MTMTSNHRIEALQGRLGRATVFVLVGGGALVGAIFAGVLPSNAFAAKQAELVDTNIQLPDPELNLSQAREASPFSIVLPTALPDDAKLLLVDWIPPDQNFGTMNVDLIWTSSVGDIHLFETNNPSLPSEKDPSNPELGKSVNIDGRSWVIIPTQFEGRTQIGTQLPSGVTLEVDAEMSDQDLVNLASSIK
jgi:hypothetical protein